mmetsp:Transcript_5014/g.12231  ORF Transcript_5014/g.12231 Transcript_5014/m.12231 type:complete len:307 (-) Transcript_5014:351-1271(-)
MSELRQRKGEVSAEVLDEKDREIARLRAALEAQSAKETKEPKEETKKKDNVPIDDVRTKQMIDEISQALKKTAPNQVKGLSNEAKVFKDKLAADPFNMELIFQLGMAYGQDQQWDKCLNVMLRGWKRVGEFQDPGVRFEFLCLLTTASQKEKKHRQAYAILQDIVEPDDEELRSNFELLRCQVYCDNGDMQKGLKSLNKAIEGADFDKAAALWANCLDPLKKCGAYDISKSNMLDLATSQEDKDKLEAMEKLAALRDEYYASHLDPVTPPSKKYAMYIGIGVLVVVGLYLLYLLESMSLSKLKVKG